ncbi:MAG: P1 family peptidase, partial [Deinococcus sp.]|nr:P1 family peptidase [Deinococcus sp.]
QCQKLAQMAHDGMARAIQPAHTMFDGDVIFALSTGNSGSVGPAELSNLGALAADTFSRAIIRGVLAAKSAGGMTSYREAFPEA